MIKNKLKRNSLFFKIFLVVVIGILCVSFFISCITINISRDIFEKSYIDSQEKIADQIHERLYNFHREASEIINSMDSNKAVRQYFSDEELSYSESFTNLYNMKSHVKSIFKNDEYNFNMLIVALNERKYLDKNAMLEIEPKSLLEMDISKNTLEKKGKIIYQFLEKGITSITKNEPVIVISKALNLNNGEPYGIIYLMIKESEFKKIYDYFSSDLNDVSIINENNIILSSNKEENLGNKVEDLNHDNEEIVRKNQRNIIYKNDGNINFSQKILGSNLLLDVVININRAVEQIYDARKILSICLIITLITLILLFFIVKQVTKPLYILVEKMANLRLDKVDEHVEIDNISSISEINQLTTTYNSMIKDINNYIDKLVKIQKEKRMAEINALQAQINPHYVFNTLSSIKWLMWQGNNEKSIEMLDSFMILLRNTISRTDEFITIKEEIENLKHYVLINNARYGDRINVEYFVMPDCDDYFIPKLILQPFIENAFFHGFPSGEEGKIEIFIRRYEEDINIKIIDNGIGIESDKLDELRKFSKHSSKGFSGIGINNVNDRIKLIYGQDYGVDIKSKLGNGTEISILLPIQREN